MVDARLNLCRVDGVRGVLPVAPRLSNGKIAQRNEAGNGIISQRAITEFFVQIGHDLPLRAIDRDRVCWLAHVRGFLAGLIDEIG